ncbi:MAG: DciA family protein [Candidatus Arsenophonus melophagi]|nr:DciA family protein [Candidatus Arsenophonus melophagi]
MRDSYPQPLNILLKANNFAENTLQIIQQRVQFLIKLNNTVIALLPVELKSWCLVANYRQNILIIEVTNASRKTRLNYELPTLLETLRNSILPSLSSINIMINPASFYEDRKYCFSTQKKTIKPLKKIINKISQENGKTITKLASRSQK